MTGIALSLQTQTEGRVAVDSIVFDRDIEDVNAQNLIIVGGPCVNTVAAELLGNKPDCTEGFTDGAGKIQLIPLENDNYALLVAGKWGEDTRRAGTVVARFEEYNLKGNEMQIEPTASSATEVN